MSFSPTGADSLAFNSLLLNAMPGKHLVLWPDAPTFTIAAVSDDYLEAFRIRREDLVGHGIFEIFLQSGDNPSVARQLLQSLTQVLQTREAHPMADQQHQWPHAETGAMEWRTWRPVNKPVVDHEGKVTCLIHTIEDVTHTRQLVEIAEANRYLQAIINGFKEPLQVLQPVFENGEIVDFRFTLTNQAYASYANATPGQLQGKQVGEVFPGYFETESFTNPVRTYLTGEPLTFEIHYDKDGLDLYNVMSTSRLDGEVVLHFTDFTRVRQLQFQLESKIEELKRSNQQLDDFAHAASHDLKEPIRKIQAFAELLESSLTGRLTEREKSYLDRVQTAARRMSTLIQALLTYSEVNKHSAEREDVGLNDVVRQVLQDLDYELEQKGATVSVSDLCVITGHRRQWEQVFHNLMGNALKYAKADTAPQIRIGYTTVSGQEVTVSLSNRSKTYHLISVQDNGIGFPQRDAERIFDVFTRLHGVSQYQGSGIGLSTVKKVVTNHQGHIWAESSPGEGATFHILVPQH